MVEADPTASIPVTCAEILRVEDEKSTEEILDSGSTS